MSEFPRLSKDLKHARALDVCQACGTRYVPCDAPPFARWQECDQDDQPEPVCVVLCSRCAGNLIDPHPRAYRRMQPHEPLPGAMPICVGCVHQVALCCRHPDAAINGGPGLALRMPEAQRAFVDGAVGGRRQGWVETVYRGPVTGCTGREESGERKHGSGEESQA